MPELKTEKLANAACLRVDVDFTGDLPVITDAKLMFGTSFAAEEAEEGKSKRER